MAGSNAQTQSQLANIEADTGMTVADFTVVLEAAQLERHGQMVAFLKTEHGLGHGNANLIAHLVRQHLEGGPASDHDLLEAQYAGAKASLRPIYEALAKIALQQGDDVDQVIQKTGVSFRRRKQFALVQAASAKRLQLGLNLDETPPGGRVIETKGMCTHRVDLGNADDVDDEVSAWIGAAYAGAG